MQAQTLTRTTTKVDIRRVAECFAADLSMLVLRTKTMDLEWADDATHDITLMAVYGCLATVHVQLLDYNGKRVAAHVYKVEGDGAWDQNRPGGNNWPNTPGGELVVIVSYSNSAKANQLKRDDKLRFNWSATNLDTNYLGMKRGKGRQYSSGSYGWSRTTYTK